MKVFAGRYSWDGKKHARGVEPIAWFPGSYNLKIFNVSSGQKGVMHLKPYVCIYSATGEGLSISANPEKFVKHICHDFSLEMGKVLWAEESSDNSGEFEVVTFTEKARMGDVSFYIVEKRKPLAGEQRIIEKELAALQR
jgi:hypothetical protein